jgi:tRNA A-37 threonylcarbamoyl transferase component Bud32
MTASIPESAGIFISYRREDAAYPAGWLFDRLNGHFGGRVFKDVDSIQPGDDFVAEITAAVESCAVLLAVIGKQWLTVTDEEGQRRLDDRADFVRLEIEAAFTRDVRVIPILVDGARMPRAAELPASLQKLVRRQALELSPNHFSSDASRLLRVLDAALAKRIQPEAPSAAAAGRRGSGTGQAGTSGSLPSMPRSDAETDPVPRAESDPAKSRNASNPEPARHRHVSAPPIGTAEARLLGGRYELDAVVGRGSVAEVYRARDIRLDRIVAIKTLRVDLARNQEFQARFRREAQAVASLNHPSIVRVYDTGEDMATGVPVSYIVMEYVDGRTVRNLLQESHRLLPERSLEVIDGVLRALEYGHQAGIVHRDIKPGNVMVTRNGDVKVMDFGIAWAMGDAQVTTNQTVQVIGTAQYLSPEQARGELIDARSDLYSTGCVLYELLTGRPPFTGDSPVVIAYQHVREKPVPPSQVNPDVPAWADAIVLKAMAKAPADRYQTAAEMRADLQRAASGTPVSAPPTRLDNYPHPPPGKPHLRRWPFKS